MNSVDPQQPAYTNNPVTPVTANPATTDPSVTTNPVVDQTVTTTTTSPAVMNSTETVVLKYLKHFGLIALYGAGSVVLIAVLQMVGTLNVQTLPLAWQGFAVLLVPTIITALTTLKQELDAKAAAEAANNLLMAERAKNVDLSKQLVIAKSWNNFDNSKEKDLG